MALRKRVGLLNGVARLGALGEAELQFQILVDICPLVNGVGRQEALQSTGKSALPDGTADGATDSTTDVAEDTEEGKRTGCVLVIGGGEDGNLLDDDHGTAGESEEDLAHDQVANGLVRSAEVDHETLAQHVERDSPVEHPTEASSSLDEETDSEEPDAGDNVEDVGNVTGGLEGLAAVDLQEGSVVVVPACIGDLIADVKSTGAHDSAGAHDLPLQEWHWSHELLGETEGDEADDTEDEHGDDAAVVPLAGCGAGKVERNEEEDKASEQQEGAED